MFTIDFMGPFNPPSYRGNQYIIVGVEYFSWFTFTRPTEEATAEVAFRFMQEEVAAVFRWPACTYTDNGSHFTGAAFKDQINQIGTKTIFAPVTAPWLVRLAERHVQLVLASLRAMVATSPE